MLEIEKRYDKKLIDKACKICRNKKCDCNEEHPEYESEELGWENYTKFEDIVPNGNSTHIIRLRDHEIVEKEINKIRQDFENKEFQTEYFTAKYEWDFLKIFSDKKEIAIVFRLENCLSVKLYKTKFEKQLEEYFFENYGEEAEFFGEVNHIEETIKLKNSKISAKIRTGNLKKDSSWEPSSFLNFYINGDHIGKALIRFHASEMNDCGPTIMMFEIFPEFRHQGYGSEIMYGIEYYMFWKNFSLMRLDNTKTIPFWVNLGYDIDIDEGEKYLDPFDYED